MANLAQELSAYLAAADGVVITNEDYKVAWWSVHRETLSYWAALVKTLFVIRPSSAAAERAFSLPSSEFSS